uniref:Uncharacterized protein n=1 Tax=Amphimedon queenslandica TaxID=400682 RepID=A0A1X7UP40_AMPQE
LTKTLITGLYSVPDFIGHVTFLLLQILGSGRPPGNSTQIPAIFPYNATFIVAISASIKDGEG